MWGSGKFGDGKESFQNAMSHWLGGWVKDKYGVNFNDLTPSGKLNAVFNLLGTMESVEGVINASHGVSEVVIRKLTYCRGRSCVSDPATIPDSNYSGLPSDGDRLETVLKSSEYNSDLYAMTTNALNSPATGYWTWGNIGPGAIIPSNTVYIYDNFVILNGYRK